MDSAISQPSSVWMSSMSKCTRTGAAPARVVGLGWGRRGVPQCIRRSACSDGWVCLQVEVSPAWTACRKLLTPRMYRGLGKCCPVLGGWGGFHTPCPQVHHMAAGASMCHPPPYTCTVQTHPLLSTVGKPCLGDTPYCVGSWIWYCTVSCVPAAVCTAGVGVCV